MHEKKGYSAEISKILLSTYFTIFDIEAEYLDTTFRYLNITNEYIRCLQISHGEKWIFNYGTAILYIQL